MKTDGAAVARRVYIFMAILTIAGLGGAWVILGVMGVFGFGIGSVLSFANAWWMHRIAMSIGSEERRPATAAIFAVLRYLIMLVGLYVILDYSESGFLAALAGCFVHVIAVVLEVVYELTYGTS